MMWLWLRFLRAVVGLENGVPGVMMAIHTFDEYPDKFYPHLHAVVTNGLSRDTGTFYIMRQTDLKPLEELFRADNGVRIEKTDVNGREAITQYIMRNAFNIKKVNFVEKT